MQARVPALRTPSPLEAEPLSWPDVEPEELEDAARNLCAVRPGSRAAERLMERACYLRSIRTAPAAGQPAASLLLLA